MKGAQLTRLVISLDWCGNVSSIWSAPGDSRCDRRLVRLPNEQSTRIFTRNKHHICLGSRGNFITITEKRDLQTPKVIRSSYWPVVDLSTTLGELWLSPTKSSTTNEEYKGHLQSEGQRGRNTPLDLAMKTVRIYRLEYHLRTIFFGMIASCMHADFGLLCNVSWCKQRSCSNLCWLLGHLHYKHPTFVRLNSYCWPRIAL